MATQTSSLQPGDLLTEGQASEILQVQVQTLRNWRWRGDAGPRYHRIGQRLIRYHRADLAAFIDGEASA